MIKRLLVALLAATLALLPLTSATADDHIVAEPTLEDIVADAVAEYLAGLDLDTEDAEAIAAAIADLVAAVTDAAAEAAAEQDVEEGEPADEEEEEEAEELEGEEEADDGRGEFVSMVAQCAPNGKLLKGTGVNHGTFVSAVASGEAVVVPTVAEDGSVETDGEGMTVESVEDAEALCEALDEFAADLEAAAEAAAAQADEVESAETESGDTDEGETEATSKRDEAKARKADKAKGQQD